MTRTGFVSDTRFEAHHTGPHHPESAARMSSSLRRLGQLAWRPQLIDVEASPASIAWVESCHSLQYIRRVEQACKNQAPWIDTADVTISEKSSEVALLAAGSGLALADQLIAGTIDNGFALLRPPGHHAEHDAAMGFCLFNNVAILARYLRRHHRLDKIAIVDWDVHHGNGTQHAFESDPSVFYFSVHQYPYYPGTGSASENGLGQGRGATLNCPLPAGSDDQAYREVFSQQLVPALNHFKPDCIIISAGFDAHADDPLADMRLSTEIYGWMTDCLLEVADHHAGGRLISMLEGGYDLNRLADCVAVHLARLSGHQLA